MSKGFAASFETVLDLTLEIGQKIKLPTLFGIYEFAVEEIDYKTAKIGTETMLTYLSKNEENKWVYNHFVFNRNVVCKGIII